MRIPFGGLSRKIDYDGRSIPRGFRGSLAISIGFSFMPPCSFVGVEPVAVHDCFHKLITNNVSHGGLGRRKLSTTHGAFATTRFRAPYAAPAR